MDLTPPLKRAKLRAVLFDKDGTLFGFHATWAGYAAGVIEALSGGDSALEAALDEALGFDMARRRFRPDSIAIAGTGAQVAARAAKIIHRPENEVAALLDQRAKSLIPVPAAPIAPLRTTLKNMGLRVGIATNDSEESTRAQLAALGLLKGWDMILGADSGHGAKPSPGMCLAFAEQLGLAPGEVLMVGDSLHDLDAAKAAGMPAVGVLSGVAQRSDLAPVADAVLDDISALPAWISARADPSTIG